MLVEGGGTLMTYLLEKIEDFLFQYMRERQTLAPAFH